LYVQGFDGADLVNFELELTTPSIIFEQEKIALYKEKVLLANDILEKKLLSTDFLYEKIFNLSKDEYEVERARALKDAERTFRINQIELEGNDPVETGTSFGTPHDLAALYSNKRAGGEIPTILPTGYDEKKPGRPPRDSSYDSQYSNFGKDVSGSDGMKNKNPFDVYNKKTIKFEHNNILESLKADNKVPNLLNEENILND